MNHLIAKRRGRYEEYVKLLSDQKVFELPDNLENAIEYEASYMLEEDEWFIVNNFTEQQYCPDFLKLPIDSTVYPSISGADFMEIEYICSYQQEDEYYFQRVYKKRYLKKRRIINFSNDVTIKETDEGIIINDIPDALYLKSQNRLYFRKLETIAPIFKGIELLYREATRGEVEQFFEKKFVKIGDGYNSEKVGKANRHRLAIIQDTLRRLNKRQKRDLLEYTASYYPELPFDGKAFTIRNETDLKNLLYGIEQRYYTTPVTHEKRRANSVQKIE